MPIRLCLPGSILIGGYSSILSNLSKLELETMFCRASCEEWRNIFTNSTSLENPILRSLPFPFFGITITPPPISAPSLPSLTLISSFNYRPIFHQLISVSLTPSLDSGITCHYTKSSYVGEGRLARVHMSSC
ncbi:hypothetical protein JAAARDRAFT_33343 [Jaapia argillacea MUCL 33604]|uniref:Uncharacterized protein n=1 Tax=Jaapia argillacea MUCL 33604 TaxID=933084 RepID=A0A067Q0W1_9AGAM|nr:hypothetical protein JAAARDRAFT_33343 [Jaapia argillacea MUCL 33604]